MNENEFKLFLKKSGKKEDVIERNIKGIKKFEIFCQNQEKKDLTEVTTNDIEAFIDWLEKEEQISAKGYLYVLMNYFKFTANKSLLAFASKLREKRTEKSRRIFPLKEFIGVNPAHIEKLATIGIKNVDQMLIAGKTKVKREELANKTGIPFESILDLVKLSDITRAGYIKAKLARLYCNAGIYSPSILASYKPEQLQEHFRKYIEETGWDGVVPFLTDLKNNIANAKKMKDVVEY